MRVRKFREVANAPPQQEKVWALCYLNQVQFDYVCTGEKRNISSFDVISATFSLTFFMPKL